MLVIDGSKILIATTTSLLLVSGANILLVNSAGAQVDPRTGQTLKEVDPAQASQSRLEAQERHRARVKAHRKRIIETGKNDHAPTPEEYSPELESEKPGAPKVPDQYVSKRMRSESDHTDKIDMKPYMAEVSRRIKAGWVPPARQENKTVGVSFLVTPNGAVGNLLITKSSGSASADKAARHAVLRAAPFAPLPKGCTQPQSVDYTFDHTAQLDKPSYQMGVH